MTRKEKEMLSVLSDSVYVVVSGVRWTNFIPTKVYPGRHTMEECKKIISYQLEKWRKNPPKQKSKKPRHNIIYLPPEFEIYNYKEVPKI